MPLIQAGMRHRGFALIDVLSPGVTFNDHEGSTKSYTFTREHYHPAIEADYVPPAQEISVDYPPGEALPVQCTRSRVVLHKLGASYDPPIGAPLTASSNRSWAKRIRHGLIHLDEDESDEFHNLNKDEFGPA